MGPLRPSLVSHLSSRFNDGKLHTHTQSLGEEVDVEGVIVFFSLRGENHLISNYYTHMCSSRPDETFFYFFFFVENGFLMAAKGRSLCT